ncbi:unnamed protein product [Effrenium voratum]|uniref:subtilisin n=1 Tax=Effrenium voratum TaxID=2562239 RepID=A0AA36IK26_9DINO|nr:unnamed protein product [Effrenium voratum]
MAPAEQCPLWRHRVGDAGLRICEGDSKDCAADHRGHGTRLAGLVGGHRYGVAKHSTIHAVKVLDDQGRGRLWQLLQALDWLLVNAERPAVAVLSAWTHGQLSALRCGLEQASAAGITVVVAAGDFGLSACEYTPSYLKEALVVGATTRNDTRANFSSTGSCIDLMAPGEDILTCGISSDGAEVRFSGSGAAAAHAAGAAALLLAEKPDLAPGEVMQTLLDTSTVGRLSQLEDSPDRLLNTLGEQIKIPAWGEKGMWSLVDGGVDRQCGHEDSGEAHFDRVDYPQVRALEKCRALCEKSAATTGCAGISYSQEEEMCQIHVELVRASVEMTGYICLRHEAPTTTTLTSTSSTRTSSSSLTTTHTTMTATSSTVTTKPSLTQLWSEAKDENCFFGFGGERLPNGEDYVGLRSLEDCLQECEKQAACEGALYQSFGDVGNCWLRSNVRLKQCVASPGISLWHP